MNWLKKNDFFMKFLSFVIALIVWMYVAGTNNFQEEYKAKNLEPEFFGLEDLENSRNLALVGEYSVDIELSGTYTALLSLNERDIKVEVDLARMGITSPGTYEVPYTVELPSSAYSLKSKKPQKLTLTFDKEKFGIVPVKVVTEGLAENGFIVDKNGMTIAPKELKVSGLQADVEKIAYAEVDTGKGNMKSTVSGEFSYKFYDAEGNQLKNVSVEADYDFVNVTIPILKTKTVPIALELQGSDNLKKYVNYSFEPKSLKIAGNENVIDSTPELVVGTMSVSEISSGMEKSFTITLPDGVVNLSGEITATAKIEMEAGLKSKTISTSLIQVKNADLIQGNKIKIVTTSLPVTVFGTEASIASITPENIRVIADLKSTVLSKGTHPVAVSVRIDGVSDVIVANPDEYFIIVEVK